MTETAASVVQTVDWLAIAPPTIVAAMALVVLVVDLFADDTKKAALGWLSVAGLTFAALALLPLLDADRSTFCRTDDPSVCSFTADRFTLVIQFLVLGGALLAALLSVSTLRDARCGGGTVGTAGARTNRPGDSGGSRGRSGPRGRGGGGSGSRDGGSQNADVARTGVGARVAVQVGPAGAEAVGPAGAGVIPDGEFWFLLLSSAAGAALLPAARDLATLIVALEVASLPAFALVGLRRGERKSAEAALKFFLSSVIATAVTLLGVSFVYGATGSLYLTEIADRLPHVDGQLHTLAQTGVTLTLVGFAFKTAAVPFHFWVPDTYVGAPLPIAAYLSVVGKAVGFSGLVLVTVLGFPAYADVWGPALAVLAALTMSAGNLAALRQQGTRAYSAIRLLAWSSVGQAGYLLVPIAAAGYAEHAKDTERAIGATVTYALMYAAVNLGAFAVAALVARSSPLNRLSDYRGLYARRPLSALLLGFFLLCLAGLPPGVIGLFAKVTVFSSAVDAGLGWLAVIMAVNVVIALYYYLQWTALLFRVSPAEAGAQGSAQGDGLQGAGRESGGRQEDGHQDGDRREDDGSVAGPAGPAVAAIPLPLTAAIALTAVLALAFSGAPQLILRFSATALF